MSPRRRSPTARVAMKTILVVLLSITSLVLARALIGIEITVDAVTVAKGEVVDDVLELHTLPEWQADGDLRLSYDDGTREHGFASLLDGEVVVTTIDFGTETLVAYLRRQGIDGVQVPIASSCELMDVAHPLFGVFCAAYDPARRPPDHPDVTGLTCSTCHDAGEVEAAYARATGIVPVGSTPPAGHREIGSLACSTCHAGAAGETALAPGGATPPPGHRPIGSAACSSCHGGTPGDAAAGDPGATPTPPPGHRPIGSATCSSCHGGTPGDGGAGAPVVAPPPGHRPIGTAVCSSCHGSGGYDDDDEEEHDDEHEDEPEDEHEDEPEDEHDD